MAESIIALSVVPETHPMRPPAATPSGRNALLPDFSAQSNHIPPSSPSPSAPCSLKPI